LAAAEIERRSDHAAAAQVAGEGRGLCHEQQGLRTTLGYGLRAEFGGPACGYEVRPEEMEVVAADAATQQGTT
jgi:hypothetical protein